MVYKKKYKEKLTKHQQEAKKHEELLRKRLSDIAISLKTETDTDKIERLQAEKEFLNERLKVFKIAEWRKSSPSVRTYRG